MEVVFGKRVEFCDDISSDEFFDDIPGKNTDFDLRLIIPMNKIKM